MFQLATHDAHQLNADPKACDNIHVDDIVSWTAHVFIGPACRAFARRKSVRFSVDEGDKSFAFAQFGWRAFCQGRYIKYLERSQVIYKTTGWVSDPPCGLILDSVLFRKILQDLLDLFQDGVVHFLEGFGRAEVVVKLFHAGGAGDDAGDFLAA